MLRSVPNLRIGGLRGGAIYNYRYTSGKGDGPHTEESFGPFHDAHDFHLSLRRGLSNPVTSEEGENQIKT